MSNEVRLRTCAVEWIRLIIRITEGSPTSEADRRLDRNSNLDDDHRVRVRSDPIAMATFAIPTTNPADPGPSRSVQRAHSDGTSTDRHSNERIGGSGADLRARTTQAYFADESTQAEGDARPSDPQASDDTPPTANTRTEYNAQPDHTTITEVSIDDSAGGHEHPPISDSRGGRHRSRGL